VKSYIPDDTIVAVSTPPGEGGISIVRLSGPDSAAILGQLFAPAGRGKLRPRRLTLGRIFDPRYGQPVDEVLVSFMPAPHTYTRQDVIEINSHGGAAPARRILELCLLHGARLAGPGEFTLRAFLNGRLDLAQAEAVLDVIRARTDASLRVAVGQLAGGLSRRIRSARHTLLGAQAHLVASIDFPNDEIPALDVAGALDEGQRVLAELLREADRGIIYRQGVRAAIIGRPNVGKSSLLNALLRVDRAIVTPIAGTTRDTVEETLNLQGIPVVLVDTAGLRASAPDPIEQLGIERSRAALQRADLALVVVDRSTPLEEADREVLGLLGRKPALLALNKADLPARLNMTELPAGRRCVAIAAATGEGLPQLEAALVEMILSGEVMASDDLLVSNPRHKAAIAGALESVEAARRGYAEGAPADLLSIDLAEALEMLGEITGETAGEELLDRIFGEFCIGK
jgi:tRNA modification GTPase